MAASVLETSSPLDLLSALDAHVARDTWKRAMAALGGLRGLVMTPTAILELYGIPERAALTLYAAMEFSRLVQSMPDDRPFMSKSSHVDRLLRPLIASRSTERFYVLCLDGDFRLLHHAEVAKGSEDQVIVEPRAVFAPAIAAKAAAIIVAHNHPSGRTDPSPQDLALTEQLHRAGETLNVHLVDHVILGHPAYTSLRDAKLLGAEGVLC